MTVLETEAPPQRRLLDYMAPGFADRYPRAALSEDVWKALEMPIPDHVGDDAVRRVAGAVARKIPVLAKPAATPSTAEMDAAQQQSLPGWARLVTQAGQGFKEAMPSLRSEPEPTHIPPPSSRGERLARTAGGIVGFGAVAAPITAVTGGAGAAPLVAEAVGGGLAAASAAGTGKQRLARGATMAALGAAGSAVTGAVGKAAGRMAGSSAASKALRLETEGAGSVLDTALEAERAGTAAGERAGRLAAGLPVSTVLFGGAAPYAEAGANKALGEHAEMPKLEDVVRGMGELGIVGAAVEGFAHGSGAAADALRRPAAPAAAQPAPAGEGAPSYREAGAPSIAAPAQQKPITQTAMPPMTDQQRGAVFGVFRGNGTDGPKGRLMDREPNPLDQNRTPLQGAIDRVKDYTAQGIEHVEAARRARREVLGLKVVHDAIAPPPGGTPELVAQGRATAADLSQRLAGQPIVLRGADGKETAGRVQSVNVYPWSDQQVRVLLVDEHTGQVAPAVFPTVDDFTGSTVALGAAAEKMAQPPPAPSPASERVTLPIESSRPEHAASIAGKLPPEAKASVVSKRGRHLVEVEKSFAEGGPVESPRAEEPGTPAPERESAPAPPATPEEPEPASGPAPATEVKPFREHFDDLVRKGRSAEDARAEAEKLSGVSAPGDFDAEARAKNVAARESEARGQSSLFGEPEATEESPRPDYWLDKPENVARRDAALKELDALKPRIKDKEKWKELHYTVQNAGVEEHVTRPLEEARRIAEPAKERRSVPREAPGIPGIEDVPAPPAAEDTGSRAASTMRAQSLHFHEPFQQRDVEHGLVDPEHVQTLLQRHEGYSADAMEKSPITVWRDEKGDIGPEGRVYVLSGHHRTHIAQHEWQKLESGEFASTSTSDREVPVVFHKGDYASAQAEADASNLVGKPNTLVEKAGVARRALERGKSLKEIALSVTQGKQAQAKQLLNLSHLDSKLQREFFGEAGLPLNIGAHLGAFVERTKLHPEHQRAVLRRVTHGELRSADEVADMLEKYERLMAAANQTDLFPKYDQGDGALSMENALDLFGRVTSLVTRERRSAAALAREANKVMDGGATGTRLSAYKAVLEDAQRRLKRLSGISDEAEKRALRAVSEAMASGQKYSDALAPVKKWIEEQVGEPSIADEMHESPGGGALSAFGVGEIHRALHRALIRYRRRVAERAWNRLPREERSITIERRGEVVKRVPIEFNPDPYTELTTARLLTGLGIGGGDLVLPFELRNHWRAANLNRPELLRHLKDEIFAVLGPDGLAWAAPHTDGSRKLQAALDGKKVELPGFMRGKLEAVRTLYNAMHATEVQAHLERGYAPDRAPRYRKAYAPHIFEGEPPADFEAFAKAITSRQFISGKELRELHNRFHESRLDAAGAQPDFWEAFDARAAVHARTVAYGEAMDATIKWLKSAEAAQDPVRAARVAQLIQTGVLHQQGVAHRMLNEAMGWLLLSRRHDGVQRLSRETAAEWLRAVPDKHEDARFWKPIDPKDPLAPPQPWGNFVAVDKDFGGEIPKGFEAIGRTRNGLTVYRGDGVGPRSPGPEFRPWLSALNYAAWRTKMGLQGKYRVTPEATMEQIKWRRAAARVARDPLQAVQTWASRGVLRSLVAWNARTIARHLLQVSATTIPEHSLFPTMTGARDLVADLGSRRGARRIAKLETDGSLSATEAKHFREALRVTGAQHLARIVGESAHFEGLGLDQMIGRVTRASKSVWTSDVGPLGQLIALQRGLGVLAAAAHARRKGFDMGALDRIYSGDDAGRMQLLTDVTDELTRESPHDAPDRAAKFVMESIAHTQFEWNWMSQPLWMSSPLGRMIGSLTTWPLNFHTKHGLLPAEAAVRRTARAMRRPGPIDAALETNGKQWATDDYSARFVRGLIATGVMAGAGQALNVNLMLGGVTPQSLAAMGALALSNPEQVDELIEEAKTGAEIDLSGGPFHAIMGPIARQAEEAFKDPHGPVVGLGAMAMEFALWRTVPALAQLRRFLQANPDWYDNAPGIYRALKIKTVYRGLSGPETAKFVVGILPPHRMKEAAFHIGGGE